MPSGRIRAVLFDAGYTLLFPQIELVIADLKEHGYAATPEDFYAAERLAKQKLDEWLWPMMRAGTVPEQIDYYYWTEYLREFTAGWVFQRKGEVRSLGFWWRTSRTSNSGLG